MYFNQDAIIARGIVEANKYLKAPVSVGKISLSLFDRFPQVAIKFENITIQESIPESKAHLLNAKKLYLSFDVIKVIQKQYVISEIHIANGNILVRTDSLGRHNFDIIKKDSTQKTQNKNQGFALKNISLEDISVIYKNEGKNTEISLYTSKTIASLKNKKGFTEIALDGAFKMHQVGLGEHTYFKEKNLSLKSKLKFDANKHTFEILPTSLNVEGSRFELTGLFDSGENPHLNIDIEGINTNIQTLLSLLSKQIYDKVSMYESKGIVYFKGNINGSMATGSQPDIKIQFGCQNASFFHPQLKKALQNTSFQGDFENIAGKTKLQIVDLVSTLDGKKIEADIVLEDFKDPKLSLNLNANLNIASIASFYPIPKIQNPKGDLGIDFYFSGKLADLKTNEGKKHIDASGEININNLSFNFHNKPFLFNDFNINAVFNKNDVSFNSFTGKIGKTDVALDGFFKNIIPYLLVPDEPLLIRANGKSTNVDLDELLTATGAELTKTEETKSNQPKEAYKLSVSPNLLLDINCDIEKLKFRKFKASDIRGNLQLDNGLISMNNMKITLAGSKIEASASLDTKVKEKMVFQTKTKLRNIDADSVFHLFEEFDQKFITSKNLKGKLNSDLQVYLELDKNLNINSKSVLADVDLTIINGQLINFEPIQKLSKFVDDEELKNIKFKEIKNSFHIENQKIIIPEMVIRSNLNTISVSGTHTFANQMDYRIKIQLKNYKKKNTAEEETAMETAPTGTTLFLKLTGTPPNIKIAYDTKSVAKKIVQKMDEEKKEFLDIFKKKTKEQKQVNPNKKVEIDTENEIEF